MRSSRPSARVRPASAASLVALVTLVALTACGEPIAAVGDIPGIMRVVAGVPNESGSTVEPLATDTRIADPHGVAIDPDGNLFVAEAINSRVVSIASNGALYLVRDDRICSSAICLEEPRDAALDPEGRLVVADREERRIWRIDPASGSLTALAGTGLNAASPDGTPATDASLQDPRGVAVDVDGTVYFTERTGHRVRYIDGNGVLQTLAGTSVDGFSGDGGPAVDAQISAPGGLGIGAGVLYLADSGNDRIRAIDLDAGTIETVAGNGIRGFSGDGGLATAAALNFPEDVTATGDGRRIFIADTGNHRVRHVPFATNVIETFAGNGDPTFTGDQIDAGAVGLDGPAGVATGPFGFLFVSDPGHDVVWRVVLGF